MENGVELYKKYRPQSFKEVIGQIDAVKALVDMGKRGVVPHAVLFTGPSGCGKTTLARILRAKLKCSDMDFSEVNAADFRGVDMVRDIRRVMGQAPIGGVCRVWLIDEAHSLTGDAMNAFLKLLEDTPSHVYFMLATTDPKKLKDTIITRCTEIRCKSLTDSDVEGLITSVLERESKSIDKEVVSRIVQVSSGSARKALVHLHKVIGLTDKVDMIAAVDAGDASALGIDIARLLFNRGKWTEVAVKLKVLEQEAETVRRIILGYCRSILLNSGNQRAADIMEEFRDNFYDNGDSGLALACWNVLGRK